MNTIFDLVMRSLLWLSEVSGFTYYEINILVYFLVIPFVYAVLLDLRTGCHLFKLAHLITWLGLWCIIGNFTRAAAQAFEVITDGFSNFFIIGLDYTATSELLCVFFPVVIFLGLVYRRPA